MTWVLAIAAATAKQVLANLKDDGSDIDWSQVDVGEPE